MHSSASRCAHNWIQPWQEFGSWGDRADAWEKTLAPNATTLTLKTRPRAVNANAAHKLGGVAWPRLRELASFAGAVKVTLVTVFPAIARARVVAACGKLRPAPIPWRSWIQKGVEVALKVVHLNS